MNRLLLHPLVLVAFGGALGAVARYGLSGAVGRAAGPQFPWGTLVVNLLGCLLLGALGAWMSRHQGASAESVRYLAAVGFLGSFTTFSTFAFEANTLLTSDRWVAASFKVGASVFVGLLAVRLGIALAESLMQPVAA